MCTARCLRWRNYAPRKVSPPSADIPPDAPLPRPAPALPLRPERPAGVPPPDGAEAGRVSRSGPAPEPTHGAHTEILVRYGEQHEQAILDRLRGGGPHGRADRDRPRRGGAGGRGRPDAGRHAPRRRGDPPGRLVGDGIGGYADFLERVERPSSLGDWSYEVSDAKLARDHQDLLPGAAFGLRRRCSTGCRATRPSELAVLLGNGERDDYRTDDLPPTCGRFAATPSRRSARAWRTPTPCPAATAASAATAAPASSGASRDDHLSLVAGLRRDHVARLQAAGVPTMTALAELPDEHQGAAGAARHAAQAAPPGRRCSCTSAQTGEQVYELLAATRTAMASASCPSRRRATSSSTSRATPTSATRALSTCSGSAGWPRTAARRSRRSGRTTARGEGRVRGADRLRHELAGRRTPGCHVYHYASYEEQALKTLSMWHGTREEEVDHLLRSGALVDLFRVVRQGLRISKHELLAEAGGGVLLARARGRGEGRRAARSSPTSAGCEQRPGALSTRSRATTREDCTPTRGLRDWLLELRRGADRAGGPGDLAARARRRPTEREARGGRRRAAALRSGCSPPATPTTGLLAELLIYHRREAKPAWWWFFDRLRACRRRSSRRRRRGDRRPRAAGAGGAPIEPVAAVSPMRFPRRSTSSSRARRHRPGDAAAAGEIVELDDDARHASS